jgi:hypothetical protein
MLYTWQPVIQNLSRSVVVKSESATGNRGYWFCIDRADIGAWYTEFRDLTRTVFNATRPSWGRKLGRHALTFYDYIGPVGGSKQVAGSSASVHGCSFTADPTTEAVLGPDVVQLELRPLPPQRHQRLLRLRPVLLRGAGVLQPLQRKPLDEHQRYGGPRGVRRRGQ